jgi:2-polyprenyl-3-methyl-5-hydroxy-6-metoxy-1,4-benzoquinol methylase
MPGQVDYYDRFGNQNRESILICPEPEFWTTDYDHKGRIYKEMKDRIDQQTSLINTHFHKADPVLDIGCGFGRQAIMLAKSGYTVTGIDTSPVFIDIAKNLFTRHNYDGKFFCTELDHALIDGHFRQILLFDVLEHLRPIYRTPFFSKLNTILSPGGILIISVPHVRRRISSRINNSIRKRITQHFSFFLKREEHPYPIPGKNTILKLSRPYFQLSKFIESEQTDYYVFQKP